MKYLKLILIKLRNENTLIIFVLLVAAFAQGINMFHFPYFEDDEGTYMSEAWSLLSFGKLAPYTYWYDHAPLGWIFISLWIKLVGGFFIFGTSVETGRVFMLLLHIISAFLLYKITKRLSGNSIIAALSSLIFSISPLALYFQRRVLLDNIMTFWVLVTFYILTVDKLKLRHVYLSAITLAIGILSKENAVFFIPGLLTLIAQKAHSNHKTFALVKWTAVVFVLVSLYIMYALIKGEFFPTGTFLGGNAPHVSLITTIQYQVGRSGGSIFDIKHSAFWLSMKIWFESDKFLIAGGIFSTFFISFLSFIKKQYLPYALCVVLFWYYLMHGSVIDFYITPLIPFLGLAISITVLEISKFFLWITKKNFSFTFSLAVFVALIGFFYLKYGSDNRGFNIYTSNQTKAQLQALDWIRKNLPTDTVFAMDNYGYVDLHSPLNPSGLVFPYAEYYWKIDNDPAIQKTLLADSATNINMYAMTPQANLDLIGGNGFDLLAKGLSHSFPVKIFWSDNWGVTIWQPLFPNQILLSTWNSYKQHFVSPDGQTIDPANKNNTTSEAQAYLLLRAVWENDKTEFDTAWDWTKDHMQFNNNLFGWEWLSKSQKLVDSGTAADADEDIAFALAMASKRWDDATYEDASKNIIQAIWNTEIKVLNGIPYLVAGNWATNRDNAIINPSYLATYEYRIFAQIDTSHPWKQVVDSSYGVLNDCSTAPLDKNFSAGLVPDWCQLTPNGDVLPSTEPGLTSTNYSFDAFRSTWRIALDYMWNKDKRARDLLENCTFLRNEWRHNGKILVGYTHDGQPQQDYESAVAYGANIGNFMITDQNDAKTIYQKELQGKFYKDDSNSYWEDPKNYYTQNWAWFGTALYTHNLPNIWANSKN